MIRYVHKLKYRSLKLVQRILKMFHLVSIGSSALCTFDGEEFLFYSRHFANCRDELRVLDIGANTGKWVLISCIVSINKM